jgi:hypothetical protein
MKKLVILLVLAVQVDHGNDGINNDVVAVLGDGTNNDVVAALGEHQALRFMTSSARRLGFEQY